MTEDTEVAATRLTETSRKRRTYIQAAVAGIALTALMGGLLAVDVANRPEPQEKTTLSSAAPAYAEEWERLKREAVAEGWTQEQLQEAKGFAEIDACAVDLSDDPSPEVEAERTTEKLAAGCVEPLPYTI
ncbi:hypothetical protein [Mycolicibacterium fortuitum]|uniref:hypothetical protein n=1 Tax=Mycolicibacterium fortuitum TaxID=1766 RepID=UPI001CDB6CDE|nr:hypothetical protein [Mycolicibacterium fortuitum]UBV14945.1 hypothetical protein H8Z57_30405 [Mycolicibacterium fortuitum]